jgi:hypothetical protein
LDVQRAPRFTSTSRSTLSTSCNDDEIKGHELENRYARKEHSGYVK